MSYFVGQDKNVSLHFSVVRVHLAEKMTLMATRPIGRWLTMAGLRHGRYCIGVGLTFFSVCLGSGDLGRGIWRPKLTCELLN